MLGYSSLSEIRRFFLILARNGPLFTPLGLLNSPVASEYGIDRHSIPRTEEYDARFAEWRQSHQSFHWWVEFYGIMKQGGFDVIIGNPPWKEYSSVRQMYTVLNYMTESCGNLHGLCTERALLLRSPRGCMSYIV